MAVQRVDEGDGHDKVLRFLPKPFLEAYEGLLAATFGDGLGQSAGYNPPDVDTAHCVDGGRDYNSRVPLRGGADGAGAVRRSVDKRLRAVARNIQEYLAAGAREVHSEKRCYSCGRFGEAEWSYCAHCGAVVGGAVVRRCECGPQIHAATRSAVIDCARTRGALPAAVPEAKVTVEWVIDPALAGTVKT